MLDVSYNTRLLQSYSKAVFFLFQATLLCLMAAGFVLKSRWSGELSDIYNATVYISCCTNGRRNCGC